MLLKKNLLFNVNKLCKCFGKIYSFSKGENIKDFDFPFDYNNSENISFSAVTRASDGSVVPYYQVYIYNNKLRIIPIFNNQIYTVKASLSVNVLFLYDEIYNY